MRRLWLLPIALLLSAPGGMTGGGGIPAPGPAPTFAFAYPGTYQGQPVPYQGLPKGGAPGCYDPTLITGTKGEALTFTRATASSCPLSPTNETLLQKCASGEACITYGGAEAAFGRTAIGLRVHRGYINILLRSEEFDNAAWADFGGSTITANQYTAPDGTLTGDKFTGAATTGRSQTVASVSQSSHSCSFWARCDSVATVGTCTQRINIVGTGNSAGDATCSFSATDTAWRRIQCSGAAYGAGITNVGCYIDNGTSGQPIGVWGAQLTDNSPQMRPYAVTTTAAVTVNAEDPVRFTSAGFAGLATLGSAAMTVTPSWTAAAAGQNGWLIGSTSDSRLMYQSPTVVLAYDGTNNPSVANAFVAGTAARWFNAWAAGASASSLNGTAYSIDADGFEDINTNVALGVQSGIVTGACDCVISNVCVDSTFGRCR